MKMTMTPSIFAMLFPLLSRAVTIDSFDSVVFDLTNMNNLNMESNLALDAGPSSASTVADMQQSLTQSCNTISGTITDDSASFNGDQCSRINNLFSTSASHAMTVISKIDGFAKLDQLSTSDAETLERVFRDQGTACDQAAKALDGACPTSTVEDNEKTQGNVDKEMQTAEGDLQANAARKRRF